MYYDFSEENKKETKAFIKAKIDEIERFKDEESWWEPKEINAGTSLVVATSASTAFAHVAGTSIFKGCNSPIDL